MNDSSAHTDKLTKTLLHFECTSANSRLLNALMRQRDDISIQTEPYNQEIVPFIVQHQPDYVVINTDDISQNINIIYQTLVMLNKIHDGLLIVNGYNLSSLLLLTAWMSGIHFVELPLNPEALFNALDNNERSEAA